VNMLTNLNRTQFLNDAGSFFQKEGKVKILNSYDLGKYMDSTIYGWEVELPSHLTVVLCLTEEFPSTSLPKVFLKGFKDLPSEYLHVEDNGRLCLNVKHEELVLLSPLKIIQMTFNSARELVNNLEPIDVKSVGYQDEFINYWFKQNARQGSYLVLSAPKVSPSCIYSINLDKQTIYSSAREDCVDWANAFLGRNTQKLQLADTQKTAVFVRLSELMMPVEFPKNGKELLSLAKKKGFESELNSLIKSSEDIVTVIFEYKNNGEVYYCSTSVRKKPLKKLNGFRKRNIPKHIAQAASFDNQKTYVIDVTRVDSDWIHTRGGPEIGGVRNKHVTLVGCGSLGSQVALQLAQSGINLTLIDDDLLLSENTARHLLGGAEYVSMNKAFGLSMFLKKRFPHLSFKPLNRRVQDVIKDSKEIFHNSDLIVNTTGSTSAEFQLAVFARTDTRMPPMIFGWLEAHAIAGQLLIITDRGGCYFCEMSQRKCKVTKWGSSPQEKKEPACGAYYQPYGSVDMAPIQAMVSRACLEVLNGVIKSSEVRTWIGDIALLNTLGGELTEKWSTQKLEVGFREFKEKLRQNADCKFL